MTEHDNAAPQLLPLDLIPCLVEEELRCMIEDLRREGPAPA